MKEAKFAVMLITILLLSIVIQAQDTGSLIINPKIGGFTAAPIRGSKLVRSDTISTPPENPHIHNLFPDGVKIPEMPSGALITGMVPDPSRCWAVAVTHDEEEFQRSLPEFRRLISEGKSREAKAVLHVSRRISVSTKVEQFRDKEKIGDLPEKVGSFFFTFYTPEFIKYGGYLTFLSYTPDPDNPVAGFGKDIGETIHGVIQVETTEGKHGFKYGYAMKIIKASITE